MKRFMFVLLNIINLLSLIPIFSLGLFGFIYEFLGYGPLNRFLLKYNLNLNFKVMWVVFGISLMIYVITGLLKRKF